MNSSYFYAFFLFPCIRVSLLSRELACNIVGSELFQLQITDTLSRFHHIAKLRFGKPTFRNVELERIVEFIDELYTKTTADAQIRSTLCCQISHLSRRLPHIQVRLRQYAVGVLNAHPDFRRDINKP